MTVLEPVIQFLNDYIKTTVALSQVIEGAGRPRKPVLKVLDRLVRDGYLEEIADKKIPPRYGEYGRDRRNPTWRIHSKPRFGYISRRQHITLRDRMWRLIRARRRFTRGDLARLTGASYGSAIEYTIILENCGYLRVTGKDGYQKVYMLVKDPGAQRPLTLRAMRKK